MSTEVINLVWTAPPLSLNQRMGWQQKMRETKRVRQAVAWQAKGRTIVTPVTVELLWTVTDRRQRDVDNPFPTVKAAVDGLRDAGMIPADNSTVVRWSRVRIVLGPVKRMQLIVTSVGDDDA